ncbi:MAG: 2-phospho-L-lactate transferase [Acidimicrobiales bacterium]
MYTVLSGGVGAARLLRALRLVVDESALTAVVNVGDDFTLHGLTICPDLDTVSYSLAGLDNPATGWGRVNESWRVLDELASLGGATWFSLGDLDLATHLYRSQRLSEGATKSVVTKELCARWGVAATLLPATDDPLATTFETDAGPMDFQSYFVRHNHDVVVTRIDVVGAAQAAPAPGVIDAIARAERVIIAPSNPLISIDPILRVPGVRDALAARREAVVAVSPLVAGAAIKGPAARLMGELGHSASNAGVADLYRDVAATLAIDVTDARDADSIASRDVRPLVTTTVMDGADNSRRLAEAVLS